jgi:hypothetical protein
VVVPKEQKEHEPLPGAFHEEFIIGEQRLVCDECKCQEDKKISFDEEKEQYLSFKNKVDELIRTYGSIKDIPEEKLLSVPFAEVVHHEKQKIRDAYFKALIDKYGGKIERIPIEEISSHSPVILVRDWTKRRGHFLCLAKMKKDAHLGRYGKKYFYESEFKSR